MCRDGRTNMTPFAGWQNFYVIVGSSAGALIALQFVVMTLIAEMSIGRDLRPAGSAFATPTIVHFAVVLLLSAAKCALWHGIDTVAALWGLLGLGGVVYAVIVARRMQVRPIPGMVVFCSVALLGVRPVDCIRVCCSLSCSRSPHWRCRRRAATAFHRHS